MIRWPSVERPCLPLCQIAGEKTTANPILAKGRKSGECRPDSCNRSLGRPGGAGDVPQSAEWFLRAGGQGQGPARPGHRGWPPGGRVCPDERRLLPFFGQSDKLRSDRSKEA
jgi:hypothetical protein